MARFAAQVLRCSSCAISLAPSLSVGLALERGVCINCIKQPPPVNSTAVAVDYAYPWSELIAQYKFANQPGWACFFAQLLLQVPQAQQAFAELQTDDLILPLPLSKERLQTRGFNQAWELAAQLAKQSAACGQLDHALLLRVKNTQPQTELKRQGRLDNVKNAFVVEPLRARTLKGRRVILVDDVMTSGASIFAAAEVLRSAGAAQIVAIALARTPQ